MPGRSIVLPVNLSRYQTDRPIVSGNPTFQVGKLAGVVLLFAGNPKVDCGVFHGENVKCRL